MVVPNILNCIDYYQCGYKNSFFFHRKTGGYWWSSSGWDGGEIDYLYDGYAVGGGTEIYTD